MAAIGALFGVVFCNSFGAFVLSRDVGSSADAKEPTSRAAATNIACCLMIYLCRPSPRETSRTRPVPVAADASLGVRLSSTSGPPTATRRRLCARMRRIKGAITPSEHKEFDDGEVVFYHACKLDLEGIVSKRRTRPIARAARRIGLR